MVMSPPLLYHCHYVKILFYSIGYAGLIGLVIWYDYYFLIILLFSGPFHIETQCDRARARARNQAKMWLAREFFIAHHTSTHRHTQGPRLAGEREKESRNEVFFRYLLLSHLRERVRQSNKQLGEATTLYRHTDKQALTHSNSLCSVCLSMCTRDPIWL